MAGPTKEQVDLWYNSFVNVLHNLGINSNNPLSLGLVKIYNDIDYQQFNKLLASNDHEKNQQAIDLGKSILKMPFLNSDQEYVGDNYADFLNDNMRKTDELTDEQKLMLYNAAKDNKLIVESFDSGTDYSFNSKYIKITPEGTAFVTRPFNKITAENCGENGFKPEEFEQIDRAHGRRANVIKDTRGISQNMIMEIQNSIAFLPPDQKKAAAVHVKSQIMQIEAKNQWVKCEHDLLCEARKHPTWYALDDTRHIRNEVRRLAGRTGLTPEQQNLLQEHNVIDLNIDKELMKFTGANSWFDISDLVVRDKFGVRIIPNNEYNFYKTLSESLNNDGYISINGKPCYNTAGGYGFKECAAKDAYLEEVDDLIAELAETDSRFSNDTESYNNFKAGLKELRENIKNARDINMEYDKINALFEKATDLGTEYQTAHQDQKSLSTRQRARLRVINKLNVLQEKLKAKRVEPKATVDERIMEKLVHGTFISSQKSGDMARIAVGVQGQLHYDNYKKAWREIQESPAFQEIKNLSGADKQRLAAMSTKDLTKEFLKVVSRVQERHHSIQENHNEISNEQPKINTNVL